MSLNHEDANTSRIFSTAFPFIRKGIETCYLEARIQLKKKLKA